jgi:hypothetical protein
MTLEYFIIQFYEIRYLPNLLYDCCRFAQPIHDGGSYISHVVNAFDVHDINTLLVEFPEG